MVRALNKYHRRQYYCVNIFKFLLPESKVYSNLLTFCHPCYCHPCYQPKVTGMTSGKRDDTNMFSSVIWIVFRIRNCYYTGVLERTRRRRVRSLGRKLIDKASLQNVSVTLIRALWINEAEYKIVVVRNVL